MGDHQLASVAQHGDRTKEAPERRHMARNAKKTKQVYNPLSLPIESVHHFLAVHKKQSESHKSQKKSFFISHLHPSLSNNKQITFQVFGSSPKASSRANATSTNNTRQYQATSARGALQRLTISSTSSKQHYQARKNGSHVD